MLTLTWKVQKTVPTGCPDNVPDPYTGAYPSYCCAVYHCKTVIDDRTTEFETEEKAKEFASKAPLSCFDFKLNGELLEDTREKPDNIYATDLTGTNTTTTSYTVTGTNTVTGNSGISL